MVNRLSVTGFDTFTDTLLYNCEHRLRPASFEYHAAVVRVRAFITGTYRSVCLSTIITAHTLGRTIC